MIIEIANYEQKGSPFDAETMWTCRQCGGRPRKAVRLDMEQPEHVRHAQSCPVAVGPRHPLYIACAANQTARYELRAEGVFLNRIGARLARSLGLSTVKVTGGWMYAGTGAER